MILKEQIEKAGLDKRDVAKKLGISYSTLGQYLNGFAEISQERYEKVMKMVRAVVK